MNTSATYTIMNNIKVPEVPINESLPPFLNFYVDNRFTTVQRNRIRTLIVQALGQWRTHLVQLDESGRSRYQDCVNKYARFNLSPVWFDEKLANGAAAAAVQMDGLTTMFAANGFNRASKAYIKYEVPQAGNNFYIKGVNASDPESNSLTVTINPIGLDNEGITNLFLTGTLTHAWLHREGYRHPAGKFTSYFSGEASMCLMRGNQDKVSGQNDRVLTEFLD